MSSEEYLSWYDHISDRKKNDTTSSIWDNNVALMKSVILSDNSLVEKFSAINSATLILTTEIDPSVVPYQVEWYLASLAKRGLDIDNLCQQIPSIDLEANYDICSSSSTPVTPYLLQKFHQYETLRQVTSLPKQAVVVELGAGMGGLARVIKHYSQDAKYIIIDLAETIFFSANYLHKSFPKATSLFFSSSDDVDRLHEYDFVFVAADDALYLQDLTIDLFLNIQSLGEMPNRVIRQWYDFFQVKNKCRRIFLSNRFMLPSLERSRSDENEAFMLLDKHWEVEKWEYQPLYDRCPYNEASTHAQLLLVAKRCFDLTDEEYQQKAALLLLKVKAQDWYQTTHSSSTRLPLLLRTVTLMVGLYLVRTLPTWLTTIVKKITIWRNGGLGILQLHQGGGRVIAHSALVGRLEDYSDLGTLFSLWEAVRLNPDRNTIETMVSYLDYMCIGRIAPVEEAAYYKKRLEKLSGRSNQ